MIMSVIIVINNRVDEFQVTLLQSYSILLLSFHQQPYLPSGLVPSDLRTKTLYAPFLSHIRAISSANLMLLDFITRMIFGVEYRL
jgi:hypothetical protein